MELAAQEQRRDQMKAAWSQTESREKRAREDLEALADMREDTQRRRLSPATDVDEIIGNCFKQVGVLCLNDLDLTDVKARNWIYQSVQN